jgi:hypothetical protein
MNGIDLMGFSRQSERSRRDLKQARGFAIEPRFDSVFGRLVDSNVGGRHGTAVARSVAKPESVRQRSIIGVKDMPG